MNATSLSSQENTASQQYSLTSSFNNLSVPLSSVMVAESWEEGCAADAHLGLNTPLWKFSNCMSLSSILNNLINQRGKNKQ